MEKLFLKTQGGTHMAQVALEKVKSAGRRPLNKASRACRPADATQKLSRHSGDGEGLGALIEKTKSHIIRMT